MRCHVQDVRIEVLLGPVRRHAQPRVNFFFFFRININGYPRPRYMERSVSSGTDTIISQQIKLAFSAIFSDHHI